MTRLGETSLLHRLLERGSELGGRVDHDDAGLGKGGDLVLGLALATRDDGTGVTHCKRAEGTELEVWTAIFQAGGYLLRRPGGAVRPLWGERVSSTSDERSRMRGILTR